MAFPFLAIDRACFVLSFYALWSVLYCYHNNKISKKFAIVTYSLVAWAWMLISIFGTAFGRSKEEKRGFHRWKEEMKTHWTLYYRFFQHDFSKSLADLLKKKSLPWLVYNKFSIIVFTFKPLIGYLETAKDSTISTQLFLNGICSWGICPRTF